MSERNVSVKLTANIASYTAAMDQAKRATNELSATAGRDLNQLGGKMQNVGSTMTAGVTLPLVGAGAAAVKMGMDFDQAFSQMVGLAGIPAEEIDGLKESVLDLAGETARAPQELAEALYAAASSGLDSAAAMDAVKVAALGASAGMGSTQDIVSLVASAVASYGEANITAAEATDILTATIREGRADPAELAGSLGRILPIASQLGVSFGEVGGAVAFLSNVFGDTNRTVTATNGLLIKLLTPTQQGKEALKAMGTSIEEVHAAIDSDGLLGALELLRTHGFDTNADALRSLFDDQEAYAAASALMADASGQLTGKIEATTNSAGAMAEAVAAIDPEVQALKQSWVDLQIALVRAGEIILPIVSGLAGGISDLVGWFTELDPAVQKVVLAIAAFAAAGGPLIFITGSLVRNLTSIQAGLKTVGLSATTASASLGVVSAVLVGAGVIYANYAREKAEAKQRTDEFVSALKSEAEGQRDATAAMIAGKLASEDFVGLLDAMGLSASDVAGYIRGDTVPAVTEMLAALDDPGPQGFGALKRLADDTGLSVGKTRELTTEIGLLRGAFASAETVVANEATIMGELTTSTEGATLATALASDAQERLAGWLSTRTGATEDVVAADEAAAEAAERHAEAEQVLRDAVDEARRAIEEQIEVLQAAAEQQQALIDARRSAVDATYALRDSENDFISSVARAHEVMADAEADERDRQSALDDTAQAAQSVADAHVRLADETAAAEGRTISATERLDIMNDSLIAQADEVEGPVRQALIDHIALLNGIPPEVASDILALVDEGKLSEAELRLEVASRARDAAIIADADTAKAEAALAGITDREWVVWFTGAWSGSAPSWRPDIPWVGEDTTPSDDKSLVPSALFGKTLGSAPVTASPFISESAVLTSSRLTPAAGGGAVMTQSRTYNINLEGMVGNKYELSQVVVDAIAVHERFNGAGWRRS